MDSAWCDVCGTVLGDGHNHAFNYVEPVDEEMVDSITHEPLFEPLVTPCPGGHTFSQVTILRALQQTNNTCPICRGPVTVESLQRAPLLIVNMLNKIKVIDRHIVELMLS